MQLWAQLFLLFSCFLDGVGLRIRRSAMAASAVIPPSLTLYRALMPKPPPPLPPPRTKRIVPVAKASTKDHVVQNHRDEDEERSRIGERPSRASKEGVKEPVIEGKDQAMQARNTAETSDVAHQRISQEKVLTPKSSGSGRKAFVEKGGVQTQTVGVTRVVEGGKAKHLNEKETLSKAASSSDADKGTDPDSSDVPSDADTVSSYSSSATASDIQAEPSLWWLYLTVLGALLGFGAVGCWTVSMSVDLDELRDKMDPEEPPPPGKAIPRNRERPPNTWLNDDSDSETDDGVCPPPPFPGGSWAGKGAVSPRLQRSPSVGSSLCTDFVSSSEAGSCVGPRVDTDADDGRKTSRSLRTTPGTRASSACPIPKAETETHIEGRSHHLPLSLLEKSRSKEVQKVLKAAHEYRFAVLFFKSLKAGVVRQAVYEPFPLTCKIVSASDADLRSIPEMVFYPPPSWNPSGPVGRPNRVLEAVEPSRIRSRFFTQF